MTRGDKLAQTKSFKRSQIITSLTLLSVAADEELK
jgi:hypothetical protein